MDEPINLRRQLEGHLQSLQAAGIEWAPRGRPLELPQSARRATPAVAPHATRAAAIQPAAIQPAAAATSPSAACATAPAAPASVPAAVASAALVPDDLAARRQALTVLAEEIKGCMQCPELASTRTQTVFADGQLGAELCFVGEAPGADEDAKGLPFVGAAGQLLNKIIVACGLKREEVYICNILKCRPPGNRTPLPNEAANCRGFLDRQLELVRPKYIVALGGCAAQNLLQTTVPLGQLRGKFHQYRGIPVLCTYHPAYLLPHRAPEKKREVWEDMKTLLKEMGREIPEHSKNG
jgi:uracil-DNA glycosylase